MTFMYEDILIKDTLTNKVFSAYKPNFQQYYILDNNIKVDVTVVNEKMSSGEWVKLQGEVNRRKN